MTNRQSMVTQTRISGRQFLQNKQSDLSPQGKQLIVFVVNNKTQAFKQKSEF